MTLSHLSQSPTNRDRYRIMRSPIPSTGLYHQAIESHTKRDDIGSRIRILDPKDTLISPCHRSLLTNRDDIESAILRFQRHDYLHASQSPDKQRRYRIWNQRSSDSKDRLYHHFIAVSKTGTISVIESGSSDSKDMTLSHAIAVSRQHV
ncbi:hypothetical protein AVEN_215084-1 [Araneus ventricosus]|uniref:Uncharacterized protein n=1 Tax=Araneus ventricosus TaxID=182803 RepID=A0A4Y2X0X4_ARAVE|nr:hypothetical protein AVEN_215084-1 [Araneus ventricosus]